MTAMLRTVRGEVDPSTMGITLPHEHVFIEMDCYWDPGDNPLPDGDDPTANPKSGTSGTGSSSPAPIVATST
ncbi:hypothetical protein LWC35_19230 [Pseudonocardia kujensis]|uniref:hypothetical protein n=1 Tax=Pseudonocardia kujensis TaxID=1128675 RepID=UPI001E46FE88|nr:hypothetical protein [Pseudonocardia kujensis]MCE0765017.1 hypothetical protein [Pseudonocardia kujensis]